MPRRKMIQPEPLQRFDIEDAEVIVIDENTWPIGRGEHKMTSSAEFVRESLGSGTLDQLQAPYGSA